MNEWSLTGTVLIACNCDWGCPCNFNARPSRGYCEGGWCWLIDEGRVDGVDLAGLAIAVFAKWPGAIHEGNGRGVAYLDERSDNVQRPALVRVLHGELGGPWGVFINTYALDGPHAAGFAVDGTEHHSRLRIGDAVHLEMTPMRNPVTQAETHPEIVLPEGLVVKRAALAASKSFEVRDVVAYDHSGQYTAFGRFEYGGTGG
jgi:hypothetical protein